MIFDGDHPHLTVGGRKTRLTRPVLEPEEPEPYTVGRRYPIQHRRAPTMLDADIDRRRGWTLETDTQVIVTEVLSTVLGELTDRDAKAEGFRSLYLFRQWWGERYGEWSDATEVWVVRFELDREERPLYLAPARSGSDYTQDPRRAIDESEVVDRETLIRFAKDNRERFDQHRAQTLDERLQAALSEARRRGLNVDRHEASIEQRVNALERALRSRAA